MSADQSASATSSSIVEHPVLVYTLTANVDADIAAEWLYWMQHEVLQFILDTQLTKEHKLFKVLSDDEGETYTLQFYFSDPFVYKLFLTEHQEKLTQLLSRYAYPKVAYFNTLLQQLS